MAEPGAEFQIGLAMSGAISAGAYTAGVFDFLIQALDEWEKARSSGNPGIPNHRVGIKVMSGASAGAITAAIGTIALADADQKPLEFGTPREGQQKIKCYLPKLYETWAVKPGLVAEGDEKFDFLQTDDLEGGAKDAPDLSRTKGIPRDEDGPKPVTSLLNSQLLDRIAQDAINVKKVTQSPRAYISKTLHIYMTLSNLRGVPYSVPFDNGAGHSNGLRENCYHMISHGDRVHYAVRGLGTWDSESLFADNDQKRDIEACWLVTPSSNPLDATWKDYAVCALASGAFPIGLAPRLIGAELGTGTDPGEYHNRRLPIDTIRGDFAMPPSWLPSVLAERPFWFTTADGGIIDNDPFEYARFSLKKKVPSDGHSSPEAAAALKLEDRIPFAPGKVARAVIMISPFPELKPIAPKGRPALDIVSIISALFPALIDHARFKPSEIILAADKDHGSRYLIGPSRVTSDGKEQRYGIASGLLGGFGGFAARSFRDHDFQLGRRNCQRFLQTRLGFSLPAENPIIENWKAAGVDITKFRTIDSKNGEEARYCIIPLFGTAQAEVVLPQWPRISQEHFNTLQRRIAERFDALAPRVLAGNVQGFLGLLLRLPLLPFIRNIPGLMRDKTLRFVRLTILADLVRRDQIEGWELPQSWQLPLPLGNGATLDGGDIRLVLAELLNPAHDGCCDARSLAKAAALAMPQIEKALELCQGPGAGGAPFNPLTALWEDRGDPCKLYKRWLQSKDKPFKVWKAPWTKTAPGGNKESGPLYALVSRKPPLYKMVLWQSAKWISGH